MLSKHVLKSPLQEESDAPAPPPAAADDDVRNAFDTSSVLSEASDVSALVPPAKPPRQIGCDAYEGLSTVEKMDVRCPQPPHRSALIFTSLL
jgi:hypothetical protein